MASTSRKDPEADAEAAGLRYVTDEAPGITRVKKGDGFEYRWPSGRKVTEKSTLERIRALAIPPAWTDVWIAKAPKGHLQATGRDDAGRKQYRYHERFREQRDESKYGGLAEFGETLPLIRERVERDLRKQGLPREKVLALAVALLDETGMRVGNAAYAKDGAFGLTTLRDKHADVKASSVTFTYRGKGGKEHAVRVQDPRLARLVRRCRDVPGQELFQYREKDGARGTISSHDVNDYIREAAGGKDFTAKTFRTWNATVLAAGKLADVRGNGSARARASQVKGAVKEVAEELGNTYAVTRSSYVHPDVIDAWEEEGMLELPRSSRKGLTTEEAKTLRFLKEG